MYGSARKELQEMRDQVEDAKDDLDAQTKMARRFVGGQLACAAVIAFSAVLNAYDVLPNGGNGGIIAVCVITWLILAVVMGFWIEQEYDSSLSGKYRRLKRDLARVEAAIAEKTVAQEWPQT